MWDFIIENWAELTLALLSLLGTLTALTESKADDSWVDVVKRVVNAIVLGKPTK
jgi:hypothetical protein